MNRTPGEFSSVVIMAMSGKDGVFTKNNNYKNSYI